MIGLDPKAKELMARINKKYGPGTALVGSDAVIWDRYPTGSLTLDISLGGGWPANQWSEVLGNESVGKTSLVYATIAANQAQNPEFQTLFIAAESYDKNWAESCGVDTSRLVVAETSIMEEAYEIIVDAASGRSVDCVAVDSLGMLVPADDDAKTMDENPQMGGGAKVTARFFRKIVKATKRSQTDTDRPFLGLMINQWYSKVGVVYGSPQESTGGKKKNYAYAVRLDLKRDEWIEGGTGKDKERIGQKVAATTIKNKSAPMGRTAYYDIYFKEGGPVPPGRIDYANEIATLAILFEIARPSGAWYKYGDDAWQGKSNFAEAIRTTPDLYAALEREVLLRVGRE